MDAHADDSPAFIPAPPGWCYTEPLASPVCPWCGTMPRMMFGPTIDPMAFCTNDDCEGLMWDPRRTYVELMWDDFTPEFKANADPITYVT